MKLFSKSSIAIMMIVVPTTALLATAEAKNKHYSKSRTAIVTCDSYPKHIIEKKANKYRKNITKSASENQVSPHLITAVITVESCFRQRARSPKGAAGLMQLMPATARRFGTSRKKRYNSKYNIRAGTRYLKFLLKRYRGNIALTAAAYNAGEGAVDRHNGIPPYQETQQYVRKVLAVYKKLANPRAQQQAQRVRHAYPAANRRKPIQRSRAWYINQFKQRQRIKQSRRLAKQQIIHNVLTPDELRLVKDLLY